MRQGRFAGVDPSGGEAGMGRAAPLLSALAYPAIAAAGAIAGVTVAAEFGGQVTAFIAAILGGLAVVAALAVTRARFIRTLTAQAQSSAERSNGLVTLAEEQGQTWFWETNADGLVTYLTTRMAGLCGREAGAAIGRPFSELPLNEEREADPAGRSAISFHLQSRFPFHEVPVHCPDAPERRWLLSGTPRFDALGRYLGFQGFGTPLTAGRQEAAQAARMARVDSLTGLPNRAGMEALLDEAIVNAERRKQSCALFLVDLDRFKQVNDTLGHPVGDVLLQQVAERFAGVLGQEGQGGRLGGDEFEAVFPGIGEEGHLAAIAERLIRTLAAPYLIHGHKVTIGASVGVAISRAGRTYRQALVKEADLALYAAKRAGRGTFRFFEPAMHAEETERKILEADLKDAAAKGQLKLLYQPIIAVSTETLIGFEALVRWWHPTRGLLSPAEFLPIAAAAGQMPALGEWILRTACEEASRWPAHLRLAVNIAGEQLNGAGIAALVTSALASSGLDAGRLDLEVTEDVLNGGDAARLEALVSLHALGVSLALDDFGVGAAGLTSLKAVPLARLKLHPSFLRAALTPRSRGRTLAAALMRLAEAMDLEIVAEGAETLEDLQLIRSLGCGAVQGFLFGRPMETEEARALAADAKPLDPQEAARNRPPRHSLIRVGTLHCGAEAWPVRMRNISPGGAMVECERAMAVGRAVELDLAEGLRLDGQIRWSHDGRLGVQFAQAFDLSRLGRAKREGADSMMPDYLRGTPKVATPRLAIRDLKRG
jgi:diguanylate cyclase (GGDEF)-like protein